MTTYKKRYTRIISLVFTLFIIVSCSTSSGPEGQSSLDSLKQIQTDSVQNQITYNKIYKKYNLPIPIELFSEIKYKSPDFINESLNSPANLPRYQTTVSKAFNLGIYAADLAYCSVFNRSQEAKNFFNCSKKLSEDLGIPAGYDAYLINRLEMYIEIQDSLEKIVQQSYWQTCNYLEEHKSLNVLPFIVAGGWIESLFLASNQTDENNPSAPMMITIASQKKSLNNLIEYLYDVMIDSSAFYLNAEIKALILKLNDLLKSYEAIQDTINKAQFKEISLKVKKIRQEIVN